MAQGCVGPGMQIEIWSDVVCPWCYIGKRRFERALTEFKELHPGVEVDVAYRSFQLDPGAPTDRSESVTAAYEKKFGGPEQAKQLMDRVTDEAEREGLDFRLDLARRSNTALAHRLLVLGEREGVQLDLKERIMQAYFTEGREIGDPNVLITLATEVGLDEEMARAWMDGDGGRAEVVDHLEFAAAAGIHSVPTYVFDRQTGVPGAQPTEVFIQAMEQALSS